MASSWLQEHHEEATTDAFNNIVFAGLDRSYIEALTRLPDGVIEMVYLNGNEYLLAEGIMQIAGESVLCADVVLGPGGPGLSPEQRAYIEAIRHRPMSFYQVTESQPGVGFRVRDLVDEDEPEVWVAAPVISQGLIGAKGSNFGARLLPGSPWRTSGALYPSQHPHLTHLIEQVHEVRESDPDPLQYHRDCGMLAVFGWLLNMAMASPADFANIEAGLNAEPS